MGKTDNKSIKSKIDSLSHTMTTDSGEWIPTFDYIYRPKLFNDLMGTSSDKENMPELETIPTSGGETLEWTEKPMKEITNGKPMWLSKSHYQKLAPLLQTWT